jgi:putative hemolysin
MRYNLKTKKVMKNSIFLLLILIFILLLPLAEGALNPAAVYCEKLGYIYDNVQGLCIFPDGTKVDAWKFLQGKVGVEHSYCRQIGLEIKTVRDPKKCIRFLLDECAVCVLKNGTEVEVTELMNLSFAETVCGDRICGLPENYKTCPEDCPSGSWDAFCDGVKDERCDPDCTIETDPDCNICGNEKCEPFENYTNCCKDCPCPRGYKCIENKCVKTSSSALYLIIIIVIIVVLVIVIILKSKKVYESAV